MNTSISEHPMTCHRQRLENVRPTMAKADLKNLDVPWREQIGHAVQRAIALAGMTQKEAAGALDRDQAQIARWVAGSERPQIDALFAVDCLRSSLVIALAELAGAGVELETTVHIRRSA